MTHQVDIIEQLELKRPWLIAQMRDGVEKELAWRNWREDMSKAILDVFKR